MSEVSDNLIIAPPVEEEVYPYSRVWRNIIIQVMIMSIISLILIIIGEILNLQISETLNYYASITIISLPLILWGVFSLLPERFVIQPRTSLITIFLISSLASAAIGLPIISDFYKIADWLPLVSAIDRIIGYTFTSGIIAVSIKLIVIHYITYPEKFNIRQDGIAYGFASAIGYSFSANLIFILNHQATYSMVMFNTFSNYTIYLVASFILSYGLNQTAFKNALPTVLPITVFLSALSVGIITPISIGLINGALTIDGSISRPIFGLGFLIVILISSIFITIFLNSVDEQRERQIYSRNNIS